MDRPLRVAVTLEQCWHAVPGGTARAALESVRALVAHSSLDLVGVSARHGAPPPVAWAPPIPVEALPAACAALNRQFLSVVELTVRAAVEERPELVRRALMVDPNTAATLSVDAIWDLADAMVGAHGTLLPAALRVPLRP